MAAFAVTGSTTPLGALVVAGLGGEAAVLALPSYQPAVLEASGCLVSLAVGPGPSPDEGEEAARLSGLRQALAAAGAAGVQRVVHLSSAVVYGAAADNAVPLTEDAPVHPDPAFAWAVELAEAERLVADWRDAAPDRAAAILRPALVVAPGDDSSLARALGGLSGPRKAGEARLVQFVHVHDVASAVIACATSPSPVDGPLNVAPEGWIDDAVAAALAGAVLPPPAVPPRLVRPARRLLWALGISTTPPEAESYATHPWVIAADRLRALGWAPSHTTEEALVATTSCSTLANLSPKRRQELLLVVATASTGFVLITLLTLIAQALRRARQRHA